MGSVSIRVGAEILEDKSFGLEIIAKGSYTPKPSQEIQANLGDSVFQEFWPDPDSGGISSGFRSIEPIYSPANHHKLCNMRFRLW